MSITFDVAKSMVEEELTKVSNENGEECIIASIKEYSDKGWAFSYNTKNFLIDKKLAHALAGNIPIFVSKSGDLNYVSVQDSKNQGDYKILYEINN
ncbi:YrhB domain-containing protein [Acinetobacter modestus]|uniref:YrhB domain-containing protein n=1 Tax=Acinetobacter modestus TaxID=1776740 RepID=UPI001F4B7EB4|nr:YrhB domain-containing protein [Acinetobacter modestus]MCH7388127.1 YrhB domain-containing protein [Acinetobacter modestus]